MESWKGASHLLVCVIPFGILWNAIQLCFALIATIVFNSNCVKDHRLFFGMRPTPI